MVFKLQLSLASTEVESTLNTLIALRLITRLVLFDIVLLMKDKSTGLVVTLGVHTGVNTVSSVCRCTVTILALRMIALQVFLHTVRTWTQLTLTLTLLVPSFSEKALKNLLFYLV